MASYDRARIKGKSFTLDGEAVVIGADGLSRFDELRRVEGARVAFLYAFDFLEHDGDDLRDLAKYRSIPLSTITLDPHGVTKIMAALTWMEQQIERPV